MLEQAPRCSGLNTKTDIVQSFGQCCQTKSLNFKSCVETGVELDGPFHLWIFYNPSILCKNIMTAMHI